MKTAHNIKISKLISILEEMLGSGYDYTDIYIEDDLTIKLKGIIYNAEENLSNKKKDIPFDETTDLTELI